MNDLITHPLQAIGVILAADFTAGLIHWIEDAYIREDTPLVGWLIGVPNTIHHHLPRRMTRNTWWQSNWDLLLVMGLLVGATAMLGCLTWHVWLFAFVAGNANEVHKWSHRTRRENGRLISWLQDMRILQTPHHPVLDTLHFWEGLEWLLARVFSLKRRPDSSVPGQGVAPEWITEMRRAG
jgi:ubiquitin-conjugating enzyme E2 variant